MNTQLIMDYLTALNRNNDREWYHAHKDDYKKANAAFEEFLQALMLEIGKFDSSILQNNPKDLTFKLVRDTRFVEREAAGSCRLLSYDQAGKPVFSGRRAVCGHV